MMMMALSVRGRGWQIYLVKLDWLEGDGGNGCLLLLARLAR